MEIQELLADEGTRDMMQACLDRMGLREQAAGDECEVRYWFVLRPDAMYVKSDEERVNVIAPHSVCKGTVTVRIWQWASVEEFGDAVYGLSGDDARLAELYRKQSLVLSNLYEDDRQLFPPEGAA